MKEVKARGARVFEITHLDNNLDVSDERILIPGTIEILMPIISVVGKSTYCLLCIIGYGNGR